MYMQNEDGAAGDNSSGDQSDEKNCSYSKLSVGSSFSFANRIRCKRFRGQKWNCGPTGYRVLSLDGGGVRGLVIVVILRALEKISGRRINDLFDWIIGNFIYLLI